MKLKRVRSHKERYSPLIVTNSDQRRSVWFSVPGVPADNANGKTSDLAFPYRSGRVASATDQVPLKWKVSGSSFPLRGQPGLRASKVDT